ncbi:MAG: Tad domain-containing protein [Novosphingobium sp.]
MTRFFVRLARQAAIGILRPLLRNQSGNTIALVAATIAPLLAMVGGAIDMGRSYLSESRLQQACDAGVLAARKKLGSTVVIGGMVPANVAGAGNSYFNINFRSGAYGTNNRAFTMTLQPDYSISAVATVDVPTTVMKIFAFDKIPVRVECEAKLNFSNTDVMMVLDTTGSMNDTNPGDTKPKIGVLKDVVHDFTAMMEGSKGPGIRIRYGFVPYSVNVNVGGLLDDSWVVDNWTYQSREAAATATAVVDYTYDDNWMTISGTYASVVESTYAGTWHPPVWNPPANENSSGYYSGGYYSCDTSPPASTYTSNYTIISDVSVSYIGPPAGTKRTVHYRLTENGAYYYLNLSGSTCQVIRGDYASLIREYDHITIPVNQTTPSYRYAPIAQSVTNWRSETHGCMEERATYEINDYSNVDFTQALDLDLDRVPTAGMPATQWRPAYPNIIFERSLDYYGNGSFSVPPVTTTYPYLFQPVNVPGLTTCPTAARKLAEMTTANVDTYLATLVAAGSTYHDIGMIWGGRLLSATGLFAAENADVAGKPTNRHLIFLTDGETAPRDIAYGAYGVEPLDQRRWSPSSSLSLTQVVEKRFTVACEEVKKRNITVWVIGFGTNMTNMLKDCAGNGRWFQADDATQLNAAFAKIAASMGDLRISK